MMEGNLEIGVAREGKSETPKARRGKNVHATVLLCKIRYINANTNGKSLMPLRRFQNGLVDVGMRVVHFQWQCLQGPRKVTV